MKYLLSFFLLAFVLSGCTTSYLVSEKGEGDSLSYLEFNEEMRNEDIIVKLKNGDEINASNIQIGTDSAEGIDDESLDTFRIQTSSIETVIQKNRFWGGLEGFGFGTLGGAILFGAVLLIDPGHEFENLNTIFPVSLISPLLGAIPGAAIGHKYEYEFQTNH